MSKHKGILFSLDMQIILSGILDLYNLYIALINVHIILKRHFFNILCTRVTE